MYIIRPSQVLGLTLDNFTVHLIVPSILAALDRVLDMTTGILTMLDVTELIEDQAPIDDTQTDAGAEDRASLSTSGSNSPADPATPATTNVTEDGETVRNTMLITIEALNPTIILVQDPTIRNSPGVIMDTTVNFVYDRKDDKTTKLNKDGCAVESVETSEKMCLKVDDLEAFVDLDLSNLDTGKQRVHIYDPSSANFTYARKLTDGQSLPPRRGRIFVFL